MIEIAKKLNWEKVKPEVFEDWSYNAKVAILSLNREPAYYQVSEVGDYISSTIWHGNRGIDIGNVSSLEEGQTKCQDHFNKLIYENSIFYKEETKEDQNESKDI
jgi:hypothetical protein